MHIRVIRWLLPCAILWLGSGVIAQAQTVSSSADDLLAHNQFEPARSAYLDTIKEHPEQPEPRLRLTRTLLRLDAWPEAVTQAAETVKLFPENADAHGLDAIALIRSGDWDTATKEAALSLQKDANSYWGLVASGRIDDWNEQLDTAMDKLTKATKLHPEWPDAWLAWFEFLGDRMDDPQDTALAAQAYLKLNPLGYPYDEPTRWLKTTDIQHLSSFGTDFTLETDPKRDDDRPYHVVIPIDIRDNYTILPLKIQGRALKLLFDTGGSNSVLLGDKAARQLKLPVLAHTRISGVSGSESSNLLQADTLMLGNITYHFIPINTMRAASNDFDGILPGSAIDDAVVTLDYHNRTFSIDRGKDAVAPGPLPGNKIIVVPFHIFRDHLFTHLSVDGMPMWAMIDTGCAESALSLRAAKIAANGLRKRDRDSGSLHGRMGVGETALTVDYVGARKDVPIRLSEEPPVSVVMPNLFGSSDIDTQCSTEYKFEIGMLLGMSELSQFERLTFDYPQHTLTLEYADPDAHAH